MPSSTPGPTLGRFTAFLLVLVLGVFLVAVAAGGPAQLIPDAQAGIQDVECNNEIDDDGDDLIDFPDDPGCEEG